MSQKSSNTDFFWEILLTIIAISAIRSLFKDDNGKVVSDKGAEVLDNHKLMADLEKKISPEKRKDEEFRKVVLDLD